MTRKVLIFTLSCVNHLNMRTNYFAIRDFLLLYCEYTFVSDKFTDEQKDGIILGRINLAYVIDFDLICQLSARQAWTTGRIFFGHVTS